MEMDQPIQPPLLVTLPAGGDGTTGLQESVLGSRLDSRIHHKFYYKK
jgi:hypothetical protein